MTDAEILTLVDRLERCLLGKEEFHHRDHLTVAVVYLYASDLETAMDRMRTTLKRFAGHHHVSGLYHETLTRFWLLQVEKSLDRGLCLRESVSRVQKKFSDKELPSRYYSKETLNSAVAKNAWVEADLR
jgi:hypothetical protein